MGKQYYWTVIAIFLLIFCQFQSFSQTELVIKKRFYKTVVKEGIYLDYDITYTPSKKYVTQDSLYANFWRVDKIVDSSLYVSKVISFKIESRPISFNFRKENLLTKRVIPIDSMSHLKDEVSYYYFFPDSIEKSVIEVNELENIFIPKRKKGDLLVAYSTIIGSNLVLASSLAVVSDLNSMERIPGAFLGSVGIFGGFKLLQYKRFGYFELNNCKLHFK